MIPQSDSLASHDEAAIKLQSASDTELQLRRWAPELVDLMFRPVMFTDVNGAVVWVNTALEQLCGHKLHQIQRRNPREFLYAPGTNLATISRIEEHARRRSRFQADLLIDCQRGRKFRVHFDSMPVFNEKAEFQGCVAVFTDVVAETEELQARSESLRESPLCALTRILELLNSGSDLGRVCSLIADCVAEVTESDWALLGEVCGDSVENLSVRILGTAASGQFENGSVAIVDDAHLGVDSWNPSLSTREFLLGSSQSLTTSPAQEPELAKLLPLSALSLAAIPIRTGQKTIGVILTVNSPIGSSDAGIQRLHPLTLVASQVVQQVRAATAQDSLREQLRESETLLQVKGRIGQVGAWRLEIPSMALYWSEQTRRIHGVGPEYVPQVEEAIAFYAPEAQPLIRGAVEQCIQDGTPWDLELGFYNQKGERRYVRALGQAVFHDGRVVRIFGSLQDVTDKRAADEEKERLRTQFLESQRRESVGRLAGGIAHDFNNMLAVILGHAEMLLLDPSLSPRHREQLKAIQMAGKRSADLTHQLLTFARRQNAEPKCVDPNKAVRRILDLLRKSLGEGIQLDWYPAEDVWPIFVDPAQFEQVLANLSMNARDAIQDQGRLLISTRNEHVSQPRPLKYSMEIPAGDFLVLTVSDNGCGMSDAATQLLFEPFNTTKSVGQGPGLGLATVYGIVRQNRGWIDVDSDSTIGTTFRIYFPRAENAVSGIQAAAVPGTDVGRLSILLIEDEPALVRVGKMSLRKLGHRVYSAPGARDAIQLIHAIRNTIDIVISDIVMPGINGWDLARQIASLRPGMRFVMMSGYGKSMPCQEQFSERGIPVLQKPFELSDLRSAIRSAAALDVPAKSQ